MLNCKNHADLVLIRSIEEYQSELKNQIFAQIESDDFAPDKLIETAVSYRKFQTIYKDLSGEYLKYYSPADFSDEINAVSLGPEKVNTMIASVYAAIDVELLQNQERFNSLYDTDDNDEFDRLCMDIRAEKLRLKELRTLFEFISDKFNAFFSEDTSVIIQSDNVSAEKSVSEMSVNEAETDTHENEDTKIELPDRADSSEQKTATDSEKMPCHVVINGKWTHVSSWADVEEAVCEYACRLKPFKMTMAPGSINLRINGEPAFRRTMSVSHKFVRISNGLFVYAADNENECCMICDAILKACDIDEDVYKIVF